MSGHITRMSRGSRRRVVLEQAEQHLAQHLRPGEPGRGSGAPGPTGRPRSCGTARPGRHVVGAQVGLEPAEQRAGQRRSRGDLGRRGRPAAEAALQLALVAAERGEQRVPDPAVADVVAGAAWARSGRRAAARGRRWGAGSQRCRSWCAAEGARAARSRSTGIRVWPNSDSRAAGRPGPPRSRASVCGVPLRAGSGASTAVDQAPATAAAARPGRRRASLPERRRSSAPADQSTSSCGRCAAYDANSPASRRATA